MLLEGNNTSFSTGNVVTNNVIHDVDYMCLDEAGINSGNPLYPPGNGKGPSLYDATSTYNTISYNTIYNSGRSLILIRNFGSGLIVHNDLYNAMLQSLDGGAIYTYNQNGKAFNSNNPATSIAYNRIHNTHSLIRQIADVGIYLDNNSTNYVVDHNLVYDVGLPLFLNSDSQNNTVCNNTLYATVFGTRVPSSLRRRDRHGAGEQHLLATGQTSREPSTPPRTTLTQMSIRYSSIRAR